MGEVFNINANLAPKTADGARNEDVYRDLVFDALEAVKAGDLPKTEHILTELMTDIEKAMAGEEL